MWLVGEAGALLVRPGGRRVHCWCVRADDPSLPSADRTAHLLLALREDETGFATVANLAFSGATLARPAPAGPGDAPRIARCGAAFAGLIPAWRTAACCFLDNGPSKGGRSGPIMLAMTSAALPASQLRSRSSAKSPPAPAARRLVLVPASRGDELVRRYRLARLRLEPRETTGDARFAHLKHPHD